MERTRRMPMGLHRWPCPQGCGSRLKSQPAQAGVSRHFSRRGRCREECRRNYICRGFDSRRRPQGRRSSARAMFSPPMVFAASATWNAKRDRGTRRIRRRVRSAAGNAGGTTCNAQVAGSSPAGVREDAVAQLDRAG
jgi:hypothetical protein